MHSFRFSSSCAARSSFACCSSRVAAASSFIFCSRELTISAVLALTRATSSSFAFGVRGAASPASSRSIASSSSSTSSSGSSIPSVLAGLSSSTPSAAAPLGLSTWPTWREASSCPPLPDDTPKLSTTSIEAVLEPSERWNSSAPSPCAGCAAFSSRPAAVSSADARSQPPPGCPRPSPETPAAHQGAWPRAAPRRHKLPGAALPNPSSSPGSAGPAPPDASARETRFVAGHHWPPSPWTRRARRRARPSPPQRRARLTFLCEEQELRAIKTA
eukprot:scaffold1355_cov268-Pinguiococcus_pyrenoidosus.AAC.28